MLGKNQVLSGITRSHMNTELRFRLIMFQEIYSLAQLVML